MELDKTKFKNTTKYDICSGAVNELMLLKTLLSSTINSSSVSLSHSNDIICFCSTLDWAAEIDWLAWYGGGGVPGGVISLASFDLLLSFLRYSGDDLCFDDCFDG